MARAGIQQLSLPEIYKMFKTASDEDKIKLMQTYSNLGERLGKRDQDIDYRRKRGDKDALKENTITEGIGDVFGSAWDYTKQGAKSLRDLVMGDSLKGEQEQTKEEQQVPTNDTPLPWEVRSDEFVGSKEPVVDDWENTALDTDEQLPWEAEGNAFVGSKENAEDDPLAGGMSRDPSIKLYEPEDEEVLSPQEQRFLGESAPKKEVAESPLARRARERLEALNKKQEYYANDPDARWSDMYKIDPERATFDYNIEKAQQKTELDMLNALGKDSNLDDVRAIHNAYINQKTALYNQGFDDTDPRVKIADSYIKYTGDLLAEKGLLPKSSEVNTDNVNGAPFETDTTKLNSAISEGRKAIESAVDKDGDGVVDNANEIRKKLNDVLREYNINPNSKEWKATLGEWDAMVDDIGKKATEAIRKKERAQDKATAEKDKKLAQEDKYEWLYVAYTDLKNNPNDVSSKAYATQAALRKESGAAIAQDEFLQAMGKLLPSDKYDELITELGGLAGLAANLSGQKETYLANVLARYMQYADSDKILNTYLGPKIEPYYKYKELKKNPSTDGSGDSSKVKITRRKKNNV